MFKSWSEAANIRRFQIESGMDITFNRVFVPLFLNLFRTNHSSTVLEIGAGTGHLAKELAKLGLNLTAIEPAVGMYQIATEVLKESSVNITNTSLFDFRARLKFDFALAHLVVHTIENYQLFLEQVLDLLTEKGELIFTIPHPCFYNNYKGFLGDEYKYMTPMFKCVSFNITKDKENTIENVPYFHRPLSSYLNGIVNSGFELMYFEEIFPNIETQKLYGELWEIPRYCLFRCKKIWNKTQTDKLTIANPNLDHPND